MVHNSSRLSEAMIYIEVDRNVEIISIASRIYFANEPGKHDDKEEYIKYISELRLSLTGSLEWPLRELSLANYLLFRFYLTLYTMKGQSRAEN